MAGRAGGRTETFDAARRRESAWPLRVPRSLRGAADAISRWAQAENRARMHSNLGKLGVAPHVAELAINHVKGGVQAIYDRHRYQREIGAALALWADHVRALVERREKKIVALRA